MRAIYRHIAHNAHNIGKGQITAIYNDWKNIDHTQIYSIVWRVLYGAKSATNNEYIARICTALNIANKRIKRAYLVALL